MIADAPTKLPEENSTPLTQSKVISAANTLVGHQRGINDVAWSR